MAVYGIMTDVLLKRSTLLVLTFQLLQTELVPLQLCHVLTTPACSKHV